MLTAGGEVLNGDRTALKTSGWSEAPGEQSAHTAPLLTGDLQWASQRGQIFSKWAVKTQRCSSTVERGGCD